MNRLIIILLISLNSIVLSGQIINIPADYATIQLGINAANNGDTVLVDTGIYIENINFSGKNIKLVSHFIFTMDTNLIHQTIIDGDSSGSVISIVSGEDSTAQLFGFTIRNGADSLGGGIKLMNSKLIISNCIITQNIAYEFGGGIYCNNSFPHISNSRIIANLINNEGYYRGGGAGICLFSSGGVIKESDIEYNSFLNSTTFLGGGIYYSSSYTVLKDLFINNNYAHAGGGLYFLPINSTSTLCSNLIVSYNNAVTGGGILCDTPNNSTSPTTVVNSLFNNNQVSGQFGGSGGGGFCYGYTNFINCSFVNNTGGYGCIYLFQGAKAYLINTIIANNSPAEIVIEGGPPNEDYAEAFLSFCNLFPNRINGYNAHYLEGNLSVNPLFIETGEFPYMLSDESPSVNNGTPDTSELNLPELDLAGNPRIYGDRIDMGAYENQNVSSGIEVFTDHGISIEPNPFHNETFIRFMSNKVTNVNIDLYDLTGRKIENIYTGLTISENNRLPINTNELKKGIYILLIRANKFTTSQKIIKQ